MMLVLAIMLSGIAHAQSNLKFIGVLTVSHKRNPDSKEKARTDIYNVYGEYERDDRYVDLRKKMEKKYGEGSSSYFDYGRKCQAYIAALQSGMSKRERKSYDFVCMGSIDEDGNPIMLSGPDRGVHVGSYVIYFGSKSQNRIDNADVYEVRGEKIENEAELAARLAKRSGAEFVGYEFLKNLNCSQATSYAAQKTGRKNITCHGVDTNGGGLW
jgi:hypothetical protein